MGGYILPDGSKLQTHAYIEYLEARTEQLEKLVQGAVERITRIENEQEWGDDFEAEVLKLRDDLRASLPAEGQGEQA